MKYLEANPVHDTFRKKILGHSILESDAKSFGMAAICYSFRRRKLKVRYDLLLTRVTPIKVTFIKVTLTNVPELLPR